ncbi:hypothetical protein [Pseudonocardia sp. H11422]|uniref:hypothetical protein n=1 Tax=Pseudonocardia sp. H11422 TaxID=2835866 RepID=UPI001BDD089B|nr:hypothetical protein [Pseudonocardia sp. H11422]
MPRRSARVHTIRPAPTAGRDVRARPPDSGRAALRDGDALLPDYYIVLDPDSLPETRKH